MVKGTAPFDGADRFKPHPSPEQLKLKRLLSFAVTVRVIWSPRSLNVNVSA
jgi:hypothetical protein